MTMEPQVLVVGAGPTGMMAALELARMGVAVRLVEKEREPATTSRAIGVQARTLELFAQRGMAAAMLEKGNPAEFGSIYGEGKRIFRLDFAHNGSEYGYLFFISQAETEGVLRDALAKQGVTIEREVEFVALAQGEHGESVRAVLKHGDGALEEAEVPYLIDSEGAHSVSRTTLNLNFAGKTRSEDYALGDLFADGELADTDFHIFSSEHGFMGMFPMGGGHFRLIASHPLSEPSKDTAPSEQELQTIFDQRSPVKARFHDMSWSSWFRINSRMVDKLKVGRVFLGGDAAHIHSPAGAQGMNTGIQDMVNLSWKLAMVLKGEADAKLLETYNDDRLPVIKHVLTRTEGLTDAIGSENAVFRSVFAHVAPWLVDTELVQEKATAQMSQLSLGYRSSPLSVTAGGLTGLHAGDRVPNLQLKHGALFELLRTDGFTLLFANVTDVAGTHAAVSAELAAWHGLVQGYPVGAGAGAEAAFNEVFGTEPCLMLVRPDGYAAFTGGVNKVGALREYLMEWFPRKTEVAHA